VAESLTRGAASHGRKGLRRFLAPQTASAIATRSSTTTTSPTSSIRCGLIGTWCIPALTSATRPIPWSSLRNKSSIISSGSSCSSRASGFLDIGCGWGALVLRAAKKYGARATGVTLSRNQYEFAAQRIREEGLEGALRGALARTTAIFRARGAFDKIASVGMFEHVGLRHLGAYFVKIRSLLAEGGVVMNHGITASDPDNSWVGLGAGGIHQPLRVSRTGSSRIFRSCLREMANAGLEVADAESLRRHYAHTCLEWARRLEQNREQAIAAAGEKRYRIWQIYLAGCAHGFEKTSG